MPAELFISISTLTGRSSPGLDADLVDGCRRERVDPVLAAFDRNAGAALGHVEGVGDPDDAGLDRVGLAAPAVADDRVQDLGIDHAQLGVVVAAREQLCGALVDHEQAVGLVVGTVDGHADVVEQGAAGDHDLRVPLRMP